MIKNFFLLMAQLLAINPAARLFADGSKIEELQEKLLDLHEQSTSIVNRADAEKRDLTAEEEAEIENLSAEFERIEGEIERRQRLMAHTERLQQSFGRKTEPEPLDDEGKAKAKADKSQSRGARPSGGVRISAPFEDKGKWGFRSFGEFALSVRQSAARGGQVDPRLVNNAPTTYGSEGVGADGGFAVPPDFRRDIAEKVLGESSLLSRTDQQYSSSNTMVLPKDETTPWQTTGGVQVYWENEASQLSQSKPALGTNTIRLNKLTALVPVTEELYEDAPALDAYLRRKVAQKMDFAVNLAIIQGAGNGQPLGILSSPCLKTVSKVSEQTADTINFTNVQDMWGGMLDVNRRNAVWLINQSVEAQLNSMVITGSGTNPNIVPVYLPAGGLSASPYGTLMGRPVIPTQACNPLGDKGDIILADLSQYLTVMRTAGIRADVSMHLWFDYDTLAYRFIMRVGGQPWWASTVTGRDGTTTYSPFVALEAR